MEQYSNDDFILDEDEELQAELESITKQQRREQRRGKDRRRMPQHGRELGDVYRDAVTKRMRPYNQKRIPE